MSDSTQIPPIFSGCDKESAGKEDASQILSLTNQLREARQRLFGNLRVDGADHSTACSIWGDDGLGHTAEGFKEPLPCNCGALENFQKTQLEKAKAQVAEAAEAFEQLAHNFPSIQVDCDNPVQAAQQINEQHEQLEREKAELVKVLQGAVRAFLLYGDHLDDCPAKETCSAICDCQYDASKATLGEEIATVLPLPPPAA